MMKKILTLVILFFVGVSLFAQKIDSELQQEMSQRADNEKINVFVIMTPQYDRSTLTRGASFYSDRKDRQTYVVNELKSFAETTQSDIRKSLDAMEKNDQTTTPNVLWIANALSFSATKSAIEELAKRKDVSIIGFDKEEYMLFDEDSKPADNTREMTPNITQVRANEVWNLGYTGEGVIVAVVDSGVNYNHLDLADHLWDGGTEFPYHGWDFVNNDNDPMDDNGHGTHCAGTVCGDGTAGSQTGMAPDASLMIVKCLNAAGRGSHSNCVNAMQWAVEHGCDIISMSLGAAVSDVATRTFYRNTCVAVLDAGIVAAIAAGNDGDDLATYPIPYNVGVPGGCPPPYIDPRQAVNTGGLSCSVCIGAVDYNDVPAYFTSHGPVTWADTEYGDYPYSLISGVEFGLIRPDVCAPGVSVKSANYLSTSGYSYKSGTSMATPCVAGCMALILSKDHNVTPAEMCKLLEETAVPLSESKSNLTGCGRVDVMAAISNMASGTLKLDSFTINDSQGNNDNMLNPGETVTLNLLLNNDSDFAVDNASLELATESDYISISNNVKVLPHFNAHQTIAVDNAFSFSLDEGVISGNVIAFTAAVKINDEIVGVIPFSITVYDYLLHYKEIAFLNDSNGNGSLEPGETADIRVFVENGGNVQANSLVGTLSTDYEYLTINESVKSYGNIASGDLRYADYSVYLSNSAPQNYSFDLLLTMVDNHNRQTQFAFDHEKYAINATINIEGGGTITGTGFYDRGATCVLTATPNTGYLFENWSKNNVLEHTKMSYSFVVNDNADYEANIIAFNGVKIGDGEESEFILPGMTSGMINYSLTQQLYLASEIDRIGTINRIGFYNDGYPTDVNYAIYLKYTNKTSFDSNNDWITVSDSDLVYNGTMSFPKGEWTFITLDTPFEYDGSSNLVLVVDDNSGYADPVAGRVFNTSIEQAKYYYVIGGSNIDPTNPTLYSGNNVSYKNQLLLDITVDNTTVYTVNVSADPSNGGVVTGGGEYNAGDMCTITAAANSGYVFNYWMHNGDIITTDPEYSFNVYHNWDMVAKFSSINPISFADNAVKELCVSNWDTNGDGELSYAEAATVTDLGTVFKNNTTISSFNELQYFTGLQTIGSQAFYYCSNLTSVVFPNTIKYVDNQAFYACGKLALAELPTSVTTIGHYAFAFCSSLTSVDIPASSTFIDYTAYNYCSSLEQITVADGNPIYDSRNDCNALIITDINKLLFGCKNTTVPNTVTSIGMYAFYGCSSMTSIELSNSVVSIEEHAFESCYGLTSISLSNSLTTIGNGVFYGCSELTSLVIPASVTTIGINVIGRCDKLTHLSVEDGNAVYDSRDNCNAVIETNSNKLIAGCRYTVIPNTVQSIGNKAFYAFYDLTDMPIPNSVTEIEEYAFAFCLQLASLEIPESVTNIGNNAFYYCSAISSITTHATVPPVLGNYAFDMVDKSIPLYVPCGTIETYQSATGWSDFTNIQDNCDTPISFADPAVKALCVANWDTNGDGEISYAEAAAVTDLGEVFKSNQTITSFNELQYFTGLTSIGDYAFYYCYNLSAIEIPNSVTSIGDYAFWYCIGLTAVEIPNSVTSIENWAFSSCTGLTNIEIPNSVTSIGWAAFVSCVGLNQMVVETGNTVYDSRGNCNAIIETATNILISGCKTTVIPNSVTSIGFGAFYGCTGLTAIEIPDSVISIGGDAFYDCTGLTAIEIPNTVTSIGGGVFYGCTGLTAIEIPNSVTSISYNPLGHCNSLTQIVVNESNTVYDSRDNCNAIVATATNKLISGCKTTIIPNSVTLIGYSAFYGCTGLTAIEIPNSVTSIDGFAFYSCCDLTTITVKTSTPPVLGTNVFNNVDKSIPVYIPYGTLTAYQTAPYWNEFTNFQESSDAIITFADPNVKSLCVANWDTNNDGELSYEEAAAVTDLGEVFRGNHDITSFDELQYFTGLTSIADNAFNYSISLYSIILPNTITRIGSQAFYQCYNLQSIEIPSSVTIIEDEVFGLTSNLEHITVDPNNTVYDSRNSCNAIIKSTTNALLVGCYNTIIPNTVTTIERYAFNGCENLTSISIPTSVTTIESSTFYGCSSLTSITIPASVTEIGSHVFAGNNLAQIVVEQDNTHYDSRDNCNAVIDSETNALIVGCKNTIVPNTVTKIASSAFYACDGLTSIVIPQNCSEIEEIGLYCCTGLEMITFNCVTPPTLGVNAIAGIDRSIPLYVPCGTEMAYSTAQGWNEFTNILCHESVQEFNLSAGWNWWSTYIEQDGANGLEDLETSIGNKGFEIRSQMSFDQYDNSDASWYGTLDEITNENGYMINVVTDCIIDLEGGVSNQTSHPITIHNGWTWIGYPLPIQQTISSALGSFVPSDGDMLKYHDDVSIYSSLSGWVPDSFVMMPGYGYKYYSMSSENKSLIYDNSGAKAESDYEKLYWNYNAHAFADNMVIVATVSVADIEQRDSNIELGAFVDNECRGSSKLYYFEPADRYYAIFTISGVDDEEISFAYVNYGTNMINKNCNQTIAFNTDSVVGGLYVPYELHFVEELSASDSNFEIFPNPVNCNRTVTLSMPEGETVNEILVTNSTGAVVKQLVSSQLTIDNGLSAAGLYVVKVYCQSGNVYYGKLLVK